ncbi:MAG: S41 family peptidase [Bacteroidia bacterium]
MYKIRVSIILMIVLVGCCLSSCQAQKNPNSSANQEKESVSTSEKKSIVQELKENSHLPVELRIALYRRLKQEQPESYDFENEDNLTMYGYFFLWNSQISESIEIFKLIVAEFPESANAYDSLGEAYLAKGDKELSLANYEKSLAMNPDNFHAEDQIERIKYPDRIPESPAEKFAKVYTPAEYKADLDQLGHKLVAVNPNALKFISEKDFWGIVEAKKALITEQTTYSEFVWHCSEIVASVNCSHTSIGEFYTESEMLPMALRFPMQTRWVNDQLFVLAVLNNDDRVNIKDEILSINGVAVAELMRDIYRHIPSQGLIETTKKHYFNTWSTAMIPFALAFPQSYEIQVQGKSKPIVLQQAQRFNDPIGDNSIASCGDLCLEIQKGSKSAVMTIRTFNYYRWNNFDEFTAFADRSFKELNEKEIENLIIDLRFNGGGSPESSIYLLKYLIDEPFTYFSTGYHEGQGEQEPFANGYKGKLYFLIDGNGNSTTGHFMAKVKDLQLGTIIGEELGSNQLCTAGQTLCRLGNTKLNYHIANSPSRVAIASPSDETGILPDHYVSQSIEQYLNKTDAVKAFAFELIAK